MRFEKMTAVLCVVQLAIAHEASAGPVWYQQRMFSAGTSGTLGGVPFSDASIEFSLYGDTSTVVPFTLRGTTGAENLVGISTATINQTDGGVLTATFLPSAGVFVSVDQMHQGVGFGSSGAPPSDPTFPGQEVYPAGIYVTSADVSTYDLTTQASLLGISQSCVDFPVTCNAPSAAGDHCG